jgi:hypothetical protein
MAAITYADFAGGLDRRLPINVQEANKLWVLRNAFVTQGRRLKKRPGLKLVASGLSGSVGLQAISGRLKVFTDTGSSFTPPVASIGIDKVSLDKPGALGIDRIYYADLFQNYVFVVARYTDKSTRYHYLDGGAQTYITDSNCPNTPGVTKAASRIFAPSADGQTAKYCAAGTLRDWSTASNAGFLPVALQQDTKSNAVACGTFQDALVVLFPDSAQIWNVAVDPSANAISKRMYGIGTGEAMSLASFFSDLVFLSPFGFRSMTVQAQTNRIDDNDVGVPIDSLVVPDVQSMAVLSDPEKVMGVWIHELGQYWAVMDMGSYSKVWAYTMSKSSKIACWSEYTFPIKIKAITTSAGKVYLRSDDQLFELASDQYTDNGNLINVEIQMAFQDAKTPGVNKQVYGADYIVSGSPDISFKYDPRDLAKETISQRISGDTRPGDMVPVEICAPVMAPVFRHSLDEGFELDAASFFYNLLGTQ